MLLDAELLLMLLTFIVPWRYFAFYLGGVTIFFILAFRVMELPHRGNSFDYLFGVLQVGGVAALNGLCILGRYFYRKRHKTQMQTRRNAFLSFLSGVCLCVIALLVAQSFYARTVIREAASVAGDAPYCIQIASQGEYRPATWLLDLTPLFMRANGSDGRYWQFHGVLLKDGKNGMELYNWSYWNGKFMSYQKPEYWPIFYCQPQTYFVEKLPLLFALPKDTTLYAGLGGREYRIPLAYRPNTSSDNHRLSLSVQSPDFKPLDTQWEKLTLWQQIDAEVDLEPGEHMDKAFSHEWGFLRKDNVLDASGKLIVKTECWGKTCHELFLHGGWTYDFSYPYPLFDKREQLRQRLVERINSFTLNNDRAPLHYSPSP